MSEFKQYRRTHIAEMRPVTDDEIIGGAENCMRARISISAQDRENGSPKFGDMIARNPKNHADVWLVAARYFADNFEPKGD